MVFRNDVPDLHDFEIEVYHLSKEGRNKLERTRMPNDDCWSAIFHSEHLITEAFNEKAVAWKLSEEDRVEIARQLQEFLEKKRQEKIAAIRKKEERIPRNTLLEEIPLSSETLEAIDKVRIDDLGLPISLRNTLFRARHYKRGLDLDAVGEVMALTKEQLFDIKQFGSKSAFILGRRLQDLIDPDGTNYEKDLFSNLLVSACPKTSRKHKIPGLEISVTQLLNAHFNAQTFVELRAFLKGLTLEEWQKLAKSSLKKNRKLSVFTKMARSILDSESENREGMLEEMLKFLREKDPDAISILNSRLTIDYYRRDKILSGLSERHEKFLAEHKEELKEQTDEVMYQELIKIDSRFEKGQIKGDEVFKYLL
ncbi:MAG: hypothetical protein M1450_00670 [Patescibacteria group bacterium]|nr:hypothetical protein [Patescibacteria group bacterium]